MPRSLRARPDEVQVCFRCSRASADALTDLARENGHGLRGVILRWLAQSGFAEVAQRDLARPDGRRRQNTAFRGLGLTAVDR